MISPNPFDLAGAGLGLRRALLPSLLDDVPDSIDFFEVSPENWVGVGGSLGKQFRGLTERHRFVAHGLALSLGGPAPLNTAFLLELKQFLDHHDFALYTEHLSFCSDEGHLYDLYPIPFTEQAVMHVASRIRQTQDILGRPIAVENASYYVQPPEAEMDELTLAPVWDLLAEAYRCFGVFPTLVERDSNIPPLSELLVEVERIHDLQTFHQHDPHLQSTQDLSEAAV